MRRRRTQLFYQHQKTVIAERAPPASVRVADNLSAFPAVEDLCRTDDWELIDDVI